MVRKLPTFRILKRTNNGLVLKEDARIIPGIAYLLIATGLSGLPFLASDELKRIALSGWLMMPGLLWAGLNRVAKTLCFFDSTSGLVTVQRMIGPLVVFRRRVPMDTVIPVFHDGRAYLRRPS